MDDYVFAESALTEFTVPDIEIGEYILFNCPELVKVTITGDIDVPRGLCMGNTALAEVVIEGKPHTVGRDAFTNCTALKSITLPRSVKVIEASAFDSCTELEEVNIKGRVEYIGDTAFYLVGKLKSIKVTRALKTIGDNAFCGCVSLENVDLKHVESIGEGAFAECHAITKVNLKSLEYNIPANAFRGCLALEDIKLSSSVREIGNSAFLSCALTEVKLPDFFARLAHSGLEIYQKKISTDFEIGERVRLCDKKGFFAVGEVREFDDGTAIKPIRQLD